MASLTRSIVSSLLNRAPVPYTGTRTSPLLSWGGSSSGSRTAQMQAMGSVGTLFSIVNRTSNATAQVEWKLYRKASKPGEERTEVTSHAALDLWNKPNSFMPRQEFVESFQQHIDLTGEAWWVIYRDPRSTIPLELWPVRPDRMDPVPSAVNFLAKLHLHRTGRREDPPPPGRGHLPAHAEPAGHLPRHGPRAVDPHRPRRHQVQRRVEQELLPELGGARRHHRGSQHPRRRRVRPAADALERTAPRRRRRPPGGDPRSRQVGRPEVHPAGHAVRRAAVRLPGRDPRGLRHRRPSPSARWPTSTGPPPTHPGSGSPSR